MFPRRPVTRQKDRHLMTAIRQCAGERADRIGQASGLDEGEQLAGRVDDFHRSTMDTTVS
jgi:hypothetical protein